nr:reverse transcriptase domain-containing protein [Tanacetum cinerariifolium]
MFKYRDIENEAVRLMMFPLSLTGEAKTWLDKLNEETIKTWDEFQTAFISRFFPPALFDRILGEIRAFSQHENESLTDASFRMKEILKNCHGHNLSKGNIIKIFYHGLNEITQEILNATDGGNSNPDTNKIMAQMNAMTIKMDAQYKKLQSRAKQPTPDLDDDDIPMSREEEAKFMKLFKQLNLGVGTERLTFNIDSAIKHSYSNDDTCFSINVIDEILEEDFDALLDEGSKILYSIKGTVLEEEIFSEFDKFIADC